LRSSAREREREREVDRHTRTHTQVTLKGWNAADEAEAVEMQPVPLLKRPRQAPGAEVGAAGAAGTAGRDSAR